MTTHQSSLKQEGQPNTSPSFAEETRYTRYTKVPLRKSKRNRKKSIQLTCPSEIQVSSRYSLATKIVTMQKILPRLFMEN